MNSAHCLNRRTETNGSARTPTPRPAIVAASAFSPARTCGMGASAVPAAMIASPDVVAATDSVRRGRPSRRISWCRKPTITETARAAGIHCR